MKVLNGIVFIFLIFSQVTILSQNCYEDLKVVPQDREANDSFGASVAVGENYAVVGAPFHDKDELGGVIKLGAGAAYIYQKFMGNWVFLQKIVASDRTQSDGFGWSVDIDRDRIVIGAWAADTLEGSSGGPGAVYIFKKNTSNVWIEEQKIISSDLELGDHFGASVQISNGVIAVGAYLEEHDALGGNQLSNCGSAYIFTQSSTGSWTQLQKITASDRTIGDFFSLSMSLHNDVLVCGSDRRNSKAGVAYIFEKNQFGAWIETGKISSSDNGPNQYFGKSVSVDSALIVVSAPSIRFILDQSTGRSRYGACYIFEKNSSNQWIETERLVTLDTIVNTGFASNVAVSFPYIMINSFSTTSFCGSDTVRFSGEALIYRKNNGSPSTVEKKFVASDRFTYNDFGSGIAFHNKNIFVGVKDNNTDATGGNNKSRAGAAYFFTLPVNNASLSEESKVFNIKIFPNPTNGSFMLNLDKKLNLNRIYMTDLNGRLIKEITPQNVAQYEISFKGSSGVYLLNVVSENESKTIKIIKE